MARTAPLIAPARRSTGESGQSLVEFAFVVPIFLMMMMGLIEFSLGFNALLNTNYASRAGGLMAAQAGNNSGADCLILEQIETVLNSPAERTRISSVEIQRTDANGTVFANAFMVYQRTGSTTCTLTDGTTRTVPYSVFTSGYPAAQRCNVLPPYGCPTLLPPRTTVDNIAVQISYVYPWHTPLRSLLPYVGGSMSGSGWTFVQRNVFRMEPVL